MLKHIRTKFNSLFGEKSATPVLQSSGQCPICLNEATFLAMEPYLRDSYICTNCHSIPRERALMVVIETYYPRWRELTVHESSPGNRGASKRLRDESTHYIASHYFPDKETGSMVDNFRCENLEKLTFEDASIDLHVTQDVMEHVFHPSDVFREIARTLKPGGAHIFTAPLWKKHEPTRVRARLEADGTISHVDTPVYHGNPIDEQGSLVTVDWGFDICRHIFEACGLFTHLVYIDDLSRGIRADLIEVLVTVKPGGDPPISMS
jgi:SAM-dependent methyltransferase